MIDFKNLLLAWISSGVTIVAAFADGNNLYIISAIILPIIFFTLGKTIDVVLQLYLRRNLTDGSSTATRKIDKPDSARSPVSIRKPKKQ